MRAAGERLDGVGLVAAVAAGAIVFWAFFFANGFDDANLVWIGGSALALSALIAAAILLRALPAPRLDLPTTAFFGCVFGLAVWVGLSTLWSVSPDRTWAYTNRTLVYAAFALVGVLLSGFVSRAAVANGATVLLAMVLGWALLAKCVAGIYPAYGLQPGISPALALARLRAPLGYWNELALLGAVTVPLALRLAAPRTRPPALRAAGVLLLTTAVVTTLLTYSRVGVVLVVLAAAAWVIVDRDRIESLVASALAAVAGGAAFGVALALPGITSDGQPRSVRAHDGWIFAAVLVGFGAAVALAAYALARLEARRPLGEEARGRLERVAAIVAVLVVLAGVGASVAAAGRLWREFTNPVSSQIGEQATRLGSANSGNRWRWWTEEWHAFTRHPAGGTGAGTFELTDRLLRRSSIITTEPHNTPLQFLGETGIVGFLLYVGVAVAAIAGIVRARARGTDAERAAVLALGIGVGAFFAHTVVDMDWNFVATCGPLLLAAGALVGGPAVAPAVVRVRRPLLALGAVLFAAAAVYSLAAPWLAQRRLAASYDAAVHDLPAAIADAKSAHGYDPLSVTALIDWADYETLAGHTARAEELYRQAVALEPENSSTWWALGSFYWQQHEPERAYVALNNAYTYDRYGPAGQRCGYLDLARRAVFGTGPRCPGGA